MRVAGAQTFVVMAHATFNRDAALLTGLALEAGLPTVHEWLKWRGYGPSRDELRRRTAYVVAHSSEVSPRAICRSINRSSAGPTKSSNAATPPHGLLALPSRAQELHRGRINTVPGSRCREKLRRR